MKYENIGFNSSYWKGKSEERFIKENKHLLPEPKLKEAYALINPKPKKEVDKNSN